MLNLVRGCQVYDPSLLHEGYQITDTGYTANVNAEKIAPLIEQFISLQSESIFLILEIPTNAKDETEVTPGVYESLHMDVYYLDGMTQDSAIDFLHNFGELFIHDGMCHFGFGSHGSNNEIMLLEYNIVTIYTKTPARYSSLFESLSIPMVPALKTAWDHFTHETPGGCSLVPYRNKDIYEITDYLKQYGLYFAERREK